MKFGKRVRQLREEREMHLSDLARAMGWSSVYMSDIELGHRNPPSQEKILKIAEALDADPVQLIDLAATTKKKVEFDLQGVQPHRAEMALLLARSWSGLKDEDVEKIKKILQGGDE